MTQDEFIRRSKNIYGDKDDYAPTKYINIKKKVSILCKKHNYLYQVSPEKYLYRGQRCPICSNENMRTSLFGVGINDMPHMSQSKAYSIWHRMIERGYSEKYKKKRPSYQDCTVCKEWLTFSNFLKWFNEHQDEYHDGYHLDKDILCKGNKVYSPDTCCFVPQEINSLLQCSNRGKNMIGSQRSGNLWVSRISINGKNTYIGSFKTEMEAYQAYKKAKEKYLQDMATKYYSQGLIVERVYFALMSYEVEDDD